jgi:predicted HTH domain antitoxin
MAAVTVDVPESVLAVLRSNPQEFANEMRLAAAAAWYEQGKVSQEVAAHIAGLDRTDFLLALAGMGRDSFAVDFADLDKELSRG